MRYKIESIINTDDSLILIITSSCTIYWLSSLSCISIILLQSLGAGLPVLLVLVQSPHKLLLVVPLLPRHVVPAGHHLVAHHLQAVEDLPGGDAELDPLLLLTVVLGLLLHLLRDGPHLVVVQSLHGNPPLADALSEIFQPFISNTNLYIFSFQTIIWKKWNNFKPPDTTNGGRVSFRSSAIFRKSSPRSKLIKAWHESHKNITVSILSSGRCDLTHAVNHKKVWSYTSSNKFKVRDFLWIFW